MRATSQGGANGPKMARRTNVLPFKQVGKSANELELDPRCCDIYTQLNATCTDVENVLNTGNVFTV